MSPVLQAFPQRSLKLKAGRGRVAALLTGLGGLVFGGAILAMLAISVVPPIWTDWQVRDTAMATRDARLVTGRCRTRVMLLHSCTLTLAWSSKGQSVQREVEYMFVSPGAGNFTVQARVDPQRPQFLTTDLGVDHLLDRSITAAVAMLFGLAVGVMMLMAARRGFRDAGTVGQLSGRNLQPVPVQFVAWGNEPSWTVRDEYGNQFTWPVRRKDKPFMLDQGRGLVLALREAPGSPAFPLDEKLRLVELTPDERGRVLAAKAALPPHIPMR